MSVSLKSPTIVLLTVADGGTIPLTVEDLRSLNKSEDSDGSENDTLVDDSGLSPSNRTERIVARNAVRNQAAQINAPVEIDIWKDVNRLVIEDNVAEGQGLQINYGTTFKIMSTLMDQQEDRIAVRRRAVPRRAVPRRKA